MGSELVKKTFLLMKESDLLIGIQHGSDLEEFWDQMLDCLGYDSADCYYMFGFKVFGRSIYSVGDVENTHPLYVLRTGRHGDSAELVVGSSVRKVIRMLKLGQELGLPGFGDFVPFGGKEKLKHSIHRVNNFKNV